MTTLIHIIPWYITIIPYLALTIMTMNIESRIFYLQGNCVDQKCHLTLHDERNHKISTIFYQRDYLGRFLYEVSPNINYVKYNCLIVLLLIGFHKTLSRVLMVKYPIVAHSDNSTSNASFIVKYLMVNTQNVQINVQHLSCCSTIVRSGGCFRKYVYSTIIKRCNFH